MLTKVEKWIEDRIQENDLDGMSVETFRDHILNNPVVKLLERGDAFEIVPDSSTLWSKLTTESRDGIEFIVLNRAAWIDILTDRRWESFFDRYTKNIEILNGSLGKVLGIEVLTPITFIPSLQTVIGMNDIRIYYKEKEPDHGDHIG